MTTNIMIYSILLGLMSGCGVGFGMELDQPLQLRVTAANGKMKPSCPEWKITGSVVGRYDSDESNLIKYSVPFIKKDASGTNKKYSLEITEDILSQNKLLDTSHNVIEFNVEDFVNGEKKGLSFAVNGNLFREKFETAKKNCEYSLTQKLKEISSATLLTSPSKEPQKSEFTLPRANPRKERSASLSKITKDLPLPTNMFKSFNNATKPAEEAFFFSTLDINDENPGTNELLAGTNSWSIAQVSHAGKNSVGNYWELVFERKLANETKLDHFTLTTHSANLIELGKHIQQYRFINIINTELSDNDPDKTMFIAIDPKLQAAIIKHNHIIFNAEQPAEELVRLINLYKPIINPDQSQPGKTLFPRENLLETEQDKEQTTPPAIEQTNETVFTQPKPVEELEPATPAPVQPERPESPTVKSVPQPKAETKTSLAHRPKSENPSNEQLSKKEATAKLKKLEQKSIEAETTQRLQKMETTLLEQQRTTMAAKKTDPLDSQPGTVIVPSADQQRTNQHSKTPLSAIESLGGKKPSSSYVKPVIAGVAVVGILGIIAAYLNRNFDSLPDSLKEMFDHLSAPFIAIKNRLSPA